MVAEGALTIMSSLTGSTDRVMALEWCGESRIDSDAIDKTLYVKRGIKIYINQLCFHFLSTYHLICRPYRARGTIAADAVSMRSKPIHLSVVIVDYIEFMQDNIKVHKAYL